MEYAIIIAALLIIAFIAYKKFRKTEKGDCCK